MKKTFLISTLCLQWIFVNSQTTVSSVCHGNWNNPAVWSTGNVPASNNLVEIYHNINLNVNVTLVNPGYLLIDSSGGLCGSGNFNGRFINYGPLMVGILTVQGISTSNAYTSSSGSTIVNGTWVVNSLSCAGCAPMCAPPMSCSPIACYTVNIPVNDTLSATYLNDIFSCDPVYSYEAMVEPGTFPYASGVNLAFLIYSINAPPGSVTSVPGGVVNVGDTLLLPTTNPAGGYQFVFSQGGYITFYLIAYGTPTTANQTYAYNWDYIYRTYYGCQDTLIFIHDAGCSVNPPVGMNEIRNQSFNIYPNPTTGVFTIQSEIGELEIYNTLGELIFSSQVTNNSITINLSEAAKGIYFLKIISDDKTYSQKLIIQ